MSWFDALAYAPFDRANGIRSPPTIATRRGNRTLAADLERVAIVDSLWTLDVTTSYSRNAAFRYYRYARDGTQPE